MHLFLLFFILSGFCSLVYQVAWLRLVMAAFGVTSTMIAVVLSIFMAGLSVGSWVGGRYADRPGLSYGSLLRLYGLLEGLIGLSGIITATLLRYGQELLAKTTGSEWASGSYYLASGAVLCVTLFPFCVCMGATFPVAMAAIRKASPHRSVTSFSYLYLANLLGAMLGCVTTAFVLIELFGFRGAMLIAAVFNGAIALTAAVISGRGKSGFGTDRVEGKAQAQSIASTERGCLYATLFLTGFVSMALEVIWTRQFTPFLGPVVYTFATILAIFLAGNFAGSALYRRQRGHSVLQEHGGTGALLPVVGLAAMLPLFAADFRLPLDPGVVGGSLRVVAGILPFALLVGFITPSMVDRVSSGSPRAAGIAYAVNTIGCIIGPLAAGFLLLPVSGERWATFALAQPFFLLSPFLARSYRTGVQGKASAKFRWAVLSAVVLSSMLVLLTKDYESKYPGAIVLRDGTATVVAADDGVRAHLLVNGYGMTVLTPITKMMAHLPMALHETPPAKGLVLCFGMGTSFRSMLSWEIPTTVVELVPSIPKLFSFYHQDGQQVMASPNARIVVDDARRYLNRTGEKYDVIVIDPPPPIEAAASSLLYSTEFYRAAAGRLADGGILHQWTPSQDSFLTAAMTKSLTLVFPHVRAFRSVEGWGLHFIASMKQVPVGSAEQLAARLGPKAATDLVEWGPYRTPADQFRAVVSKEVNIDDLLRSAPDARPIVDDRPINEYYILRKLFR